MHAHTQDVLVHKAQQGIGTVKVHFSVLGAVRGYSNLSGDVDVKSVGKKA
jgi:hypothetical protein